MPFALLLIGALLVTAGVRNKLDELGALLAGDFSGEGNFFYWVGGIGALGAVGYYRPLQNVSRLFLFLIIVSMLLSDQGFFAKLQEALQSVTPSGPASKSDVGFATNDAVKGGSGGGGGGGGDLAETAAKAALNSQLPGASIIFDAVGGGDILDGALSTIGSMF